MLSMAISDLRGGVLVCPWNTGLSDMNACDNIRILNRCCWFGRNKMKGSVYGSDVPSRGDHMSCKVISTAC